MKTVKLYYQAYTSITVEVDDDFEANSDALYALAEANGACTFDSDPEWELQSAEFDHESIDLS